MNYEALPDDLKDHGRFCAWRYEDRNGRQTKVPYHPLTGEAARSNDPGSFVSFSEAVQANGYDGIGIGIFNGLCAVDLDDCITDSGYIKQPAADIIHLMHSYTEVSPGGNGIHILFRADGFSYDTGRYYIMNEGLTIANPGGFIEGVSINNLLTAEPHGRNPQLADALKRIGLAERTGRGIDRIYEGSLIFGRPLPDYSASTSVTVSLFIQRSKPDRQIAQLVANEQNRLGRPLSLNTLLVLNTLKDIPKSTVNQLSKAINISETAVKGILDTSIEAGIVEGFGNGKNRTYILSPKVYRTQTGKIGYVRQVDIDETRYPELIINLAKNTEFLSRADVIQLLHVSPSKAYILLKKLVAQGVLEPVNKGHYAKYRYVGNR